MLYDNKAEQSVLGAILLDNRILDNIDITTDDFYNKFHVDIFNKIKELRDNNTPADLVTLSDKLPDSVEYISSLMSEVPTTSNVKHYAKIVKGKAIRRKVHDAAIEVAEMSQNGLYANVSDFLNDVMQKFDIEIKDKEISTIKDIAFSTLDEIEKRYNSKEEEKLYLGIPWIDKKTGGLHHSELTILAARTSVGKTALSNQFAYKIAQKGNAVAIFNLEMSSEQLTERWISFLSKIPAHKIRYAKGLQNEEWKSIAGAVEILSKNNIHIFDKCFSLSEIRSKCRNLKNQNNLDFVVIDYLQLIDSGIKGNKNEQVSHISRNLKLMSKEFKVPFLVLSQLSRANDKDIREPKLTDLRDSGSIEQDSDNVFLLHDPGAGKYAMDETERRDLKFIIAKQRSGQRDLYCTLGFFADKQLFTEVTNENERVSQTKQSGKSEGVQKDNKGRDYY